MLRDQLGSGWQRARTLAETGVQALRTLRDTGIGRAIRPAALARFALGARGMKLGPHLAVMLHAVNSPDREALIGSDRRLTYGELDHEVNQLGRALIELGVKPGDRVALMLPNSPEFVIALQALPRIGAVAAQVGNRLRGPEIAYIFDHAAPTVVLYHAAFATEVDDALARATAQPRRLVVGDDGEHRYDQAVARQPIEPPPLPRSADAGGVIVYTSGTTGKPKGASRKWSQTGLDAVADLMQQIGVRYDDRHLVVCPMYHSGAMAFTMMTLSLGGTVVILDHFEAEAALAAIARERITSMFVVPTMLVRLTALDDEVRRRYDTSSLRWVLSGAAPLATETARRFQAAFGPILWNFYGATETGLVTLAGPLDHDARPGTVGRILRGNQLRIVGDGGVTLPAGEVGEVYAKNSMLISGYHGDAAATRTSMQDGFFSVGDLGRLDRDGYLYLASRKHDMVISGGVNIYPAEIEEHLHTHPDVLEVAVVGVPDPEWGESLAAFVVTRPGSALTGDELVAYCRGTLADFKRPRRVEFLDALPRNPTGKVLKRELRARVEAADQAS